MNEMGELPVLVHGTRRLSQSGVCLAHLAERSGKFLSADGDERLECLRRIIFDNLKVNGYLGPAAKPSCAAARSTRWRLRLGRVPWLVGSNGPTHRRPLARRLHVLANRRIWLRHRQGLSSDRRAYGARQGASGVEASA
jgi:glutathione S-transferase